MTKSMREMETLLYWKICSDLKRPGLREAEAQEFSSEMKGFVVNAQTSRARHLAVASLEAPANTVRFNDQLENRYKKSNQRGFEVSILDREEDWQECRFVAPVEFTRRVCLEFLELVRADLSARDGKELAAHGFEIAISGLREGWDEISFVGPAAFTKRVSREFGQLWKAAYETREA